MHVFKNYRFKKYYNHCVFPTVNEWVHWNVWSTRGCRLSSRNQCQPWICQCHHSRLAFTDLCPIKLPNLSRVQLFPTPQRPTGIYLMIGLALLLTITSTTAITTFCCLHPSHQVFLYLIVIWRQPPCHQSAWHQPWGHHQEIIIFSLLKDHIFHTDQIHLHILRPIHYTGAAQDKIWIGYVVSQNQEKF